MVVIMFAIKFNIVDEENKLTGRKRTPCLNSDKGTLHGYILTE